MLPLRPINSFAISLKRLNSIKRAPRHRAGVTYRLWINWKVCVLFHKLFAGSTFASIFIAKIFRQPNSLYLKSLFINKPHWPPTVRVQKPFIFCPFLFALPVEGSEGYGIWQHLAYGNTCIQEMTCLLPGYTCVL